MLRKLFLMMDNWNENKPFVLSELELIRQHFDVTIICNYTDDLKDTDFPAEILYLPYKKTKSAKAILHAIRFFLEKDSYRELSNIKGEKNKLPKFLEIIKFYVNAELYFDFLVSKGIMGDRAKDSDAIFYSYWYFWKCFAVTKHRDLCPRIKVITRTHGYDLYKNQIASGYQPYKRIMDEKLDKVVFIAEHGFEYYLREYGIEKSDKHVIYKLGTKNDVPRDQLINLQEQSMENNGFLNLVSCSSVVELKRVDLIVRTLSRIDDINIHWTHFGGGPLLDEVKTLADELLGNKSNIKYQMTGQVNNSEIHDYYKNNRVDVFLMMSRSEGNPISVIEAMSYGIPIIATNINNMPNLIKGNGILIGANPTVEEIELSIKELHFATMGSLLAMRRCSRDIWENEYRAEQNDCDFVKNGLY